MYILDLLTTTLRANSWAHIEASFKSPQQNRFIAMHDEMTFSLVQVCKARSLQGNELMEVYQTARLPRLVLLLKPRLRNVY